MLFFFSEILYFKEVISLYSGVFVDYLCRGRDYVVGQKQLYYNIMDMFLLLVFLRVGFVNLYLMDCYLIFRCGDLFSLGM